MKTIFVIYTNKKLPESEIGYTKRYCFNTKSKVAVGDLIKTDTYDTPIQVVDVLSKPFKYFNRTTGQLTNAIDSTNVFPIKELQLVAANTSKAVKGSKVK